MKKTITTSYMITRLKNSPMGNPRYELRDKKTGEILGTTRPNSSLAYGCVPNNEGKVCNIKIHVTKYRNYIDSVEKVDKEKEYHALTNLRTIEACFMPPTNTRGARIKIFERGRAQDEKMRVKIISYNPDLDLCVQAMIALQDCGFKIKSRSYHKDAYCFHCDNYGSEYLEIKNLTT